MPWYRVVKEINGRRYHYEQRTWREGKRVRTESRYIGKYESPHIEPMAKTVKAVNRTIRPALNPHQQPATEKGQIAIAETGTSVFDHIETTLEKPARTTEKNSPNKPDKFNTTPEPVLRAKDLNIKKYLDIRAPIENHRLSRRSLETDHLLFLRFLENLALVPANAPKIRIRIDKKVGVVSPWFGNAGYIVTLPRSKPTPEKIDRRTKSGRRKKRPTPEPTKGVRIDFKMAYRKALALAFLDTIETQHPKLFNDFKTALEPIFKAQQKAILRYTQTFQNINLWGMSALTLHYQYSGQMSGWFQKNIASEKLGLPDHEKRRAWRTDTASLIAEIIEKGFERTTEIYGRQRNSTRAVETQIKKEIINAGTLERLSGKTRLAYRNLKRIQARQDAIDATISKLFVLRPAFIYYHNPNLEPVKLEPELAEFQKQLDQRQAEVERQRKAKPNKQ